MTESETHDTERTDQLQNIVMQTDERPKRIYRKQKEIQIELEKNAGSCAD